MYELIQQGDFQGLGQYIVIRVAITMVCWSFMVVATLVDFWSGVTTARALHEPLMSHGFRRTIAKIGSYWQMLIFALLFDILGAFISFYYLPFMTMISTLSIIIIEARSVVENNKRRKVPAAQIPEVTEQTISAVTNKEAVAAVARIIEMAKKNR